MFGGLLIILLAATSGSKESNGTVHTPLSPAVGYWQGSYTTTGQLGTSGYAMLLNNNGTGRIYDLGNLEDTTEVVPTKKVDAVWVLTGTSLQTTYKSGLKTVNTAFTSMAGTWAFEALIKGNITLNKIN
ncbi:MAG: hypothetical protein H7Y31_18115 [Chitinophagaceae bacterium]|nr:hypothetical protein [Chitinophagaceae bacterium]